MLPDFQCGGTSLLPLKLRLSSGVEMVSAPQLSPWHILTCMSLLGPQAITLAMSGNLEGTGSFATDLLWCNSETVSELSLFPGLCFTSGH